MTCRISSSLLRKLKRFIRSIDFRYSSFVWLLFTWIINYSIVGFIYKNWKNHADVCRSGLWASSHKYRRKLSLFMREWNSWNLLGSLLTKYGGTHGSSLITSNQGSLYTLFCCNRRAILFSITFTSTSARFVIFGSWRSKVSPCIVENASFFRPQTHIGSTCSSRTVHFCWDFI